MATLIDERQEEEVNDLDNLEVQDSVEEPQYEQPDPEDDLPEKYRGKSMRDLVQMHQEAEKRLGKQGSEVGELRKLVDNYIQTQLETQLNQAPKATKEEESVDWFADPDKALEQRLNSHPKIKEAEQTAAEYRKNTALQRLQQAHPDMNQILSNEAFAEWVKGSKIRTQLFVQADQQYDYDAANELFSLWKDRQQVNRQTAEVDKQVRKEQVKAASTGSARGANAPTRKKKYRRADIMRLRETDPDRYNSMADEFLLAYKEGRVV